MSLHQCNHCQTYWTTNTDTRWLTTTNICPDCIPKLFPQKLPGGCRPGRHPWEPTT